MAVNGLLNNNFSKLNSKSRCFFWITKDITCSEIRIKEIEEINELHQFICISKDMIELQELAKGEKMKVTIPIIELNI